MHEQLILIIGEVFVDTHLDLIDARGPLVRLGGVFHSARAFSSLGLNFALAYFAPLYLDDDINKWSSFLKTKGCYKLGNINKAPNVMLVQESKEAGEQGYYNILKDQAEYTIEKNITDIIKAIEPTDILIYPGRYNNSLIISWLNDYKGKIHIDFHYDSNNILDCVKRDIDTIILSTSSDFFKNTCAGSLDVILNHFHKYSINHFLIKENRGGSYCYSTQNKETYEAASYYAPIMHSVGVGDVYNSVFISTFFEDSITKKMRFAALCAAKYAETMSYEVFKNNVSSTYSNIDEISTIKGIRLSWCCRNEKNIYLAAPAFPNVDTTQLNRLYDCLLYHNFKPRLPIKENGLAIKSMKYEDELKLYQGDILLLNDCDLLIAVLLYNDPGTYVELGMFKQQGNPTIIYDPFSYCDNMFVKHTPNYLCRTIADVIEATYLCLGKQL
jgi:sugar/nucleoside kinase (ribokinase family)